MDVEGRHIVRSVIVFVFLLNANSFALTDVHECDNAGSVTKLAKNYKSVYSHCNCTITTHFSGELYFVSQKCGRTNIKILNSNHSIKLPCSSAKKISKAKVVKGGILQMRSTYVNNLSTDSTNENQRIKIYAHSNLSGLFSVTCGPEFGGKTTHKTSPISTTYTIKVTKTYASTNTTTHGSYWNLSLDVVTFKTSTRFGFSKASPKETAKGFLSTDVVYAVAAASVVVIIFVLTVLVVLYLRRRNLTCNKNNENTREAGTNHNATDPVDALYHSYQDNADGEGYSKCRLETQDLREELPANPLYQSYEENSVLDPLTPVQVKEDIYQRVSENVHYSNSAVDPRTSLQVMEDIYHRVSENVPDNNSVYSYAKPFQGSQELNLIESQNDNVYAEVNKPKKK